MKPVSHTFAVLACMMALPSTSWSQEPPQREEARPPRPDRMVEQEVPRNDWRIGIEVAPVEPLIRQHLQIEKDAGVVVRMVDRGGPAAKAGITVGDVILRASGEKVKDTESLRRQVMEAGAKSRPLVLDLIHEGKRRQVRISPPIPPQERLRPNPQGPAPAGGEAAERMLRSLREMNQEIAKQREMIRRLEKRIDELSRERKKD